MRSHIVTQCLFPDNQMELVPAPESLALFFGERPKIRTGIRVSIVGGGLAGLSCAWFLSRAGFRAQLFEATERLGGRIHTEKTFVKGRQVEIGGRFVSDSHSIWHSFAHYFGLHMYRNSSSFPFHLFQNGKDVSFSFHETLKQSVNTIYTHLWNESATLVSNPETPWKQMELHFLDQQTLGQKIQEWIPSFHQIKEWLELLFGDFSQSYLSALCRFRSRKDLKLSLCSSGNMDIIEKLASELWTSPSLQAACFACRYQQYGTIQCDFQKTSKESDFVVIATPCQAWDSIAFLPVIPLVSHRVSSVGAITLCAHVRNRFWSPGKANILDSQFGQVDEVTESQFVSSRILLQALVPAQFSCPRLLIRMSNYWKPKQLESQLMEAKEWKWPIAWSVPKTNQVWTSQKFLCEPVSAFHNRLFFIGEQTSCDFTGTMEGALRSGLRAALQIIEQVSKQQNQMDLHLWFHQLDQKKQEETRGNKLWSYLYTCLPLCSLYYLVS